MARILVLDDSADATTALEAKELGVREYFVKPLEKEELEEKPAQVLAA
jgi:PleD family two-component response regulator